MSEVFGHPLAGKTIVRHRMGNLDGRRFYVLSVHRYDGHLHLKTCRSRDVFTIPFAWQGKFFTVLDGKEATDA